MIRVLVVDDQPVVRVGFSAILAVQDGIEVVGDAADGAQAVDAAARLAPDVVLMDVRMPVLDGIEATRRITGGGPAAEGAAGPPRVLVLTTFDLDEYVFASLLAGASGFLLKDTQPDDLIAAIRVVAGGESLLAPRATRRLIEEYARHAPHDPNARAVDLDMLTAREEEVLCAVARGLSNAEIAAELYMSHATAKTHVSRLLTKLGARDRAQLVMVAYESGVVTPGSH